jgi:hypothetical protein
MPVEGMTMPMTNPFNQERHQKAGETKLIFALAILAVIACPRAISEPVLSVTDGPWWEADTWSTPYVPGETSEVQIRHHVWMNQESVSIAGLLVTADGQLETDILPERAGRLSIHSLGPVINNGTIRAHPGSCPPNAETTCDGHICLFSYPGGIIENNGDIIAGSGNEQGGKILLTVLPLGGVILNRGLIQGGDGTEMGGGVYIFSNFIWNGDHEGATGCVFAGNGIGDSGQGGIASLVSANSSSGQGQIVNHSGSEVRGGDSARFIPGGEVEVLAYPEGESGSGYAPATNEPGAIIKGGSGCPGGAAVFWGDPTDNQGTVEAGDERTDCEPDPEPEPPAEVVVDPPTGTISGDALVSGGIVHLVAGELLTIGNLNTPQAIQAEVALHIMMAPGGVLDLQNNTAGTDWFMAGESIDIYADSIQLDPNVALEDIMSPAPTVHAGSRYIDLDTGPEGIVYLAPGQTLTLPIFVAVRGNSLETIDYTITDTKGWIAPSSGTITLPGGGSEAWDVSITAPILCECGGSANVITIDAQCQTAGNPSVQSASEIHLVCHWLGGDTNADDQIDFTDFASCTTCMSGPGTILTPGCDCSDVDFDEDVDTVDFTWLQRRFGG